MIFDATVCLLHGCRVYMSVRYTVLQFCFTWNVDQNKVSIDDTTAPNMLYTTVLYDSIYHISALYPLQNSIQIINNMINPPRNRTFTCLWYCAFYLQK